MTVSNISALYEKKKILPKNLSKRSIANAILQSISHQQYCLDIMDKLDLKCFWAGTVYEYESAAFSFLLLHPLFPPAHSKTPLLEKDLLLSETLQKVSASQFKICICCCLWTSIMLQMNMHQGCCYGQYNHVKFACSDVKLLSGFSLKTEKAVAMSFQGAF